jgi:hypothetical protein
MNIVYKNIVENKTITNQIKDCNKGKVFNIDLYSAFNFKILLLLSI